MSQNKYLKGLFNTLKGLGKFQEYADFKEYRQKNWGQIENSQQEYLEWLEGMPEKERERFLYVFGEEEV